MAELQIWSDGASNVHSPKLPGGWSYVYVINNMQMDQGYAGEAPTTNQRMEIMGALKGLDRALTSDFIKENDIDSIQVVTDSAYLYRCMVEKWYVKWRFNQWKNLDNEDVKNRDLWEDLIEVVNELTKKGIIVTWKKIRGHRGLLYNEVADKLAVKGKESVS